MFDNTIDFVNLHGTDDYTLTRVNQDKYSSEYLLKTDTRQFKLSIRNSTKFDKRRGVSVDVHNAELIEEVFPVSPALTGFLRKCYFTFEVQQGDVLAASREVAIGLAGWLTASSAAALVKMTNFES